MSGAPNAIITGISAQNVRCFKVLRRVHMVVVLGLLTACAHGPPKPPPVPTVVSVAIPVSCIPKSLPPKPTYPFTVNQIINEPDGPTRYKMVGAVLVIALQRLSELEPLAVSCK